MFAIYAMIFTNWSISNSSDMKNGEISLSFMDKKSHIILTYCAYQANASRQSMLGTIKA